MTYLTQKTFYRTITIAFNQGLDSDRHIREKFGQQPRMYSAGLFAHLSATPSNAGPAQLPQVLEERATLAWQLGIGVPLAHHLTNHVAEPGLFDLQSRYEHIVGEAVEALGLAAPHQPIPASTRAAANMLESLQHAFLQLMARQMAIPASTPLQVSAAACEALA